MLRTDLVKCKGMTKFKFTQVDWKPFVLLPLISNLLFKFFQNYFDKEMAMLL